jgi:hypothetical protein
MILDRVFLTVSIAFMDFKIEDKSLRFRIEILKISEINEEHKTNRRSFSIYGFRAIRLAAGVIAYFPASTARDLSGLQRTVRPNKVRAIAILY